MNLDAFQMAFVAEVAKRDGDHEAAKHFEEECGKKVRSEISANREWMRQLHGLRHDPNVPGRNVHVMKPYK